MNIKNSIMKKQVSLEEINKAVETLTKKGAGIFFKGRNGIKADFITVEKNEKGIEVAKITTDVIKVNDRTIMLNNVKAATLGNGSWAAIDCLVNYDNFTVTGTGVYKLRTKHDM